MKNICAGMSPHAGSLSRPSCTRPQQIILADGVHLMKSHPVARRLCESNASSPRCQA